MGGTREAQAVLLFYLRLPLGGRPIDWARLPSPVF